MTRGAVDDSLADESLEGRPITMSRAQTTVALATAREREEIARLRHQVYASELRQHPENADGRLEDTLDAVNVCIVAKRAERIVGFVTITPPNPRGFSIDKYFAREELPFAVDDGVFEVRLLTVVESARASDLAFLLMYAALRYCESHGARRIVAIGRREVLGFYRRAGLEPLGHEVRSGAVTYELMSADVAALRRQLDTFTALLRRLEPTVDWHLGGIDFRPLDVCFHGGASFDAIGDELDDLDAAARVVSADVLDAWFDPAPNVVNALRRHLPWALRTSPPTGCDGLQRVIARARGVRVEHVLPGAGSSDLIFAALTSWVTPRSRVLILDPMYGEYAHVLERVIGASVDRLALSRDNRYDLAKDALADYLARGYDWVVLVNPNSPTGRHLPTRELASVLASALATTRVWVDETYIDYTGDDSLEHVAAASTNVVVCKSMSKAYALSGVRVGYLCGPPEMLNQLRPRRAPWAVSLPAQVAACEALRAPDYYRMRWQETATLRRELTTSLSALGLDVVPGCANFVLCQLPPDGPEAELVVRAARRHGVFLRAAAAMGRTLGPRAIRVAVKDRHANAVVVDALAAILRGATTAVLAR